MHVIDLFCGMGGLSLGFKQAGFSVTGYEHNPHALAAYRANVGPAEDLDLSNGLPVGVADCVVGGPPCRPWSPMNLQRRGDHHDDYGLVRTFDRIVLQLRPRVFVMENVPLLRTDVTYQRLVDALKLEYDIEERLVTYADWGAASKRRRLFVIGTDRSRGLTASSVLTRLDSLKRPPQTVKEAIGCLSETDPRVTPDHDWPTLRTIGRYSEKYATGKYGWYRLQWDQPAPSFGHVGKTYTLHPGAMADGAVRVVSPREVMRILGFPDSYVFPTTVPRTAKYRMVADAVSPLFGRALAAAIQETIEQREGS